MNNWDEKSENMHKEVLAIPWQKCEDLSNVILAGFLSGQWEICESLHLDTALRQQNK